MTQVDFPRNDLNEPVTQTKKHRFWIDAWFIFVWILEIGSTLFDSIDIFKAKSSSTAAYSMKMLFFILRLKYDLIKTQDSFPREMNQMTSWLECFSQELVRFNFWIKHLLKKYWFEPTHGQSGKIFDSIQFVNKLWVAPMSANNKWSMSGHYSY